LRRPCRCIGCFRKPAGAACFWLLAGLLALATLAIGWRVPPDDTGRYAGESGASARPAPEGLSSSDLAVQGAAAGSYRDIFRHRTFRRFAPLGFFNYGGLIAVQSLWAGPWLVQVSGQVPAIAAQGLFIINVAMLLTFMTWGATVPRLYARGWNASRLVAGGAVLPLLALLWILVLGPRASAAHWAFFCVSSTFASLLQPALGQAFPSPVVGRALSAYNLVIFSGVFVLQWGIGLAVDMLQAAGWSTLSAYRGAFSLLLLCQVAAYLWFLRQSDAPELRSLNPPR
jgi:hypothetical protein